MRPPPLQALGGREDSWRRTRLHQGQHIGRTHYADTEVFKKKAFPLCVETVWLVDPGGQAHPSQRWHHQWQGRKHSPSYAKGL